MKNQFLLNESFQEFSIGDFPYDAEHSAIGEYHLFRTGGFTGEWYDPVCNYTYRGPSWIITEDGGKHYLEQMRLCCQTTVPHRTWPTLVTGNNNWHNYRIEAAVRFFSTKGEAGIGFCYQNSLNLLILRFRGGNVELLRRHKAEEEIFASRPYPIGCDSDYVLAADIQEEHISCFVNGEPVLEADTPFASIGGKAAVTATTPARFTDIRVSVDSSTRRAIESREQAEEAMTSKAVSRYPKMKLWKIIDLQNFGTGRQIRFGHLTGTEQWHIVLAQAQKRVFKDAYCHISCLTAIDLEGNILWQRGEPSESFSAANLTADVPLQVYDIDGDGIDEVITFKNFEILILDGQTGEVKKKAKSPIYEDVDNRIGIPFDQYAFDRLNLDGIRIANFSGKDRPSDLLIKDRYSRVYALNSDLEVMWMFTKKDSNTGHFPYTFDIDGDGHDEILCGYNLVDHDGTLLWSLPVDGDHTDEIIACRIYPLDGPRKGELAIGMVSGTKGFMLVDRNGKILVHDDIGHAQRISAGNFLPDRPGMQVCATNYWGHQGIVYLYDNDGTCLWELENGLNGNIIAPVNWTGDGRDLILLNADTVGGGLIDGSGGQAVVFPEDGHPELCCEVIDLTGDPRDEIVVWDQKRMFIYTQENEIEGEVYKPVKYPHWNASNYRGEYSVPDESFLK